MSLNSWLRDLRSTPAPGRGQPHHRRRGSLRAASQRPKLEALEGRSLLGFSPAVNYPVGAYPQAVLAADFNNDTVPDLAVVNADDNSVSVLLGNGGGTFGAALTSATGNYPHALAVGDFNGDGTPDLATANAEDVSVLLGKEDAAGNGTGTFETPGSLASFEQYPKAVAVGDFNGDGTLDLATANADYNIGPDSGYGVADVWLGNGDGSFSGPIITLDLPADDYAGAMAADLNGDAFDDFVMVRRQGVTLEGSVSVLLGTSSGILQRPSFFHSPNYYSNAVAAGDLDADGHTDLVIADNLVNDLSVLLGDGDGGSSAGAAYDTGSGVAESIVLGDFNGDGHVDVATTAASTLRVLYGGGDGTLLPALSFAMGSSPFGLAAGEFNGDGWLDAATTSLNNTLCVLINDQSWPSAPPPSVRVSDASVTEGNTGAVSATFTLTLSRASEADVTVHYATADVTAAAGGDYTATTGTAIIPAGQTTGRITVLVIGDRLPEPSETYFVNLSGAANATIADGQAVGTIADDEPRIRISDVSRKEGKKNQTTLFTFTVTLSAAYDQAVTMSFQTVNGMATTSDSDYVAKTGTLTFASGETTKTITIEIKGDSKKEANETFYLDLFGNSSNGLFTKSRGIGTILNDD